MSKFISDIHECKTELKTFEEKAKKQNNNTRKGIKHSGKVDVRTRRMRQMRKPAKMILKESDSMMHNDAEEKGH